VAQAPIPTSRAPVVVDLQALQSPTTRDRGIGRYALNWVSALEAYDHTLVRAYVLNPLLAPPGPVDELLLSGKVRYTNALDLKGVELWHTMSPFDLHLSVDNVVPRCIAEQGLRHSATVYDLIPALDPENELADPVARRRYRTRLEIMHAIDGILTLSTKVANDLIARAGIDETRVHVVGAAPSSIFIPPLDQNVAQAAAIQSLAEKGLSRPYVLASSGSHPRKNNELLVRAFAELPGDLAGDLQLVITGDIDAPTANHYHHLAHEADRDDAVVVVGFVSDELLVTLTQGATCCVVAGFAEGFGLPIVEAQACATPVIVSDIAPFDELVIAEGRFDPSSAAAITAALERVLRDQILRNKLRNRPVTNWNEVARHSSRALAEILTRPSRRVPRTQVSRRRRPRLAFVTPLPPAPSGVAGYSYALIRALLRTEKVNVDVFCEGRTEDVLVPEGATMHPLSAFSLVEGLTGHFDHVVYAIGNSHHHIGALNMLKERPGVVIAHDVRLSNLYRHVHGDPSMLPGGFERALRAMYSGELPDGVGRDGELSAADVARYGLLMAREVIAASDRYLVNSEFAAALARIDAGVSGSERIATIPFAFTTESDDTPGFVEDLREVPAFLTENLRRGWGEGPPAGTELIAHFGIVDPMKRPELLLTSHAELRSAGHNLTLAFVGPIGDELVGSLAKLAEALGTTSSVVFTGALSPAVYRAWLQAATIAVQLRAGSNGEASAAVGECLSVGVPTVVSDLGWTAELPDDVVVKVPANSDAAHLTEVLELLLSDAELRRTLSGRARDVARSATFDRTARVLLSVLSDSSRADRASATGGEVWSPSRATFR
jgi:glycosyltransferase involved in cell wall biosynthesis